MLLPISMSKNAMSRFRDIACFLSRNGPATLFHPNLGVFPFYQIAHVGVNAFGNLTLISREIIFEVFQPMRSRYLNVTDGRTDRGTTFCGITALCVASRV